MKNVARLLGVGALLALTACSSSPLRLTAVTDVSQIDRSQGERLEVYARGLQMGFIPISINDRFERAYADLVTAANGRVLTDIKIEESWKYVVIGTLHTTTLQATAYPKAKVATPAAAAPAAPAAK